ncbi:VOC family protein [Ekhidna sp. MALMAid0563]|uniref:VOC family protein n=1 Tax=Ekhidna sp. MALMAid0563 TaxID=3143937 RepID=UPI0032DFD647
MNPVVHFEIPYKNPERAMNFYNKVFEWSHEQLGSDMGNYILLTTVISDAKPGEAAGAINGGMFQFKDDWPAQYPSIVIAVNDINETILKIKENGGEVLGDPMLIPGTGLYVSFLDTEGSRLSVLQPVSK